MKKLDYRVTNTVHIDDLNLFTTSLENRKIIHELCIAPFSIISGLDIKPSKCKSLVISDSYPAGCLNSSINQDLFPNFNSNGEKIIGFYFNQGGIVNIFDSLLMKLV